MVFSHCEVIKLINVRETKKNKVSKNVEIRRIKQILGLEHGKVYDDVRRLWYGHLMIMTDQDHDGFHIKGLLINFIHFYWPSLLKLPGFLMEFITPVVKIWMTKFYKDEADEKSIDLAFNKTKDDARKEWMKNYESGTPLEPEQKSIKISDFINNKLKLFSLADLKRSIPSMVDGLKPSQKKIVFCAFTRHLFHQQVVATFCGYVADRKSYHHGPESLYGTVIGLAQDFVGSNNMNLLTSDGQFGTRDKGGKDHADARYIYTSLSTMTRMIFPPDDDSLLEPLLEDGQSLAPVIPTILVNKGEGIGTGWSTSVPNYNPREVANNVRRWINGEEMVPMVPWYKGFTGTIAEHPSKVRWNEDYRDFLDSVMTSYEKADNTFIEREGLIKIFKLTSTVKTTNMHLFDEHGKLCKYDKFHYRVFIKVFCEVRHEIYEKRHRILPGQILMSDDECPEGVDYKYLLDLGIGNLTAEMFQGLSDEKKRLEIKVAEQKLKTGKSLWMTDLDNLDLAWAHESSNKFSRLSDEKKRLEIKVAEQKTKTGKSLWMIDLGDLDMAWAHESSDNQRELQHLRKNLTIDAL
ncbi:hypothetical protein MKW92_004592, partial [Papaver armeniacum]